MTPSKRERKPSGLSRIFVTQRTVEATVKQIFLKLGLRADSESHRRVLAALAYLRGTPPA